MSRLLVVEDDPDLRFLAELMLAQAGHSVVAVETAEEVVNGELLDDADLVLLDIRLPGMSGLDLLRDHINRDAGPPVIVMSAHAGTAHAQEALALGAVSFLGKPFPPTSLVDIVAEWLDGGPVDSPQ